MSRHSYLKEAKINYHKTLDNPVEDARTAALIAIAEQLKRIADVLESQSGERGFHVSAETLPYQTLNFDN